MGFHLVFIPVGPSCSHPLLLWVLPVRILRLAARASLSAATLLAIATAAPAALAHAGHGDEFKPQGDARQVRRQAESDALLGVATARPAQGSDGLTVPSTALVDANGRPLLFVQMEKTYDPVYVQTGASQGDRVVVSGGIDPTDDVVISGALSLYAESLKTQPAEPAAETKTPAAAAVTKPEVVGSLPVPALAAGAVVILAGGAIWLARRQKSDA
ncbi:MAG: cation efflux system membrane fusion protein [Cyanobium sp.]|jgi:cation efflux system membrane fusion protein